MYKKIKIWLVSLAMFAFIFSQSCYADISENGKVGLYTAALVGGVVTGIIGSLFLFGTFGKTTQDTSGINTQQKPVVLSSSVYNLLSAVGKKTTGQIVVRNAGDCSIAFDITSDSDKIIIESGSSCYQTTLAGSECSFDISYTGEGQSATRTPVTFTIGNASETADSHTVNIIDMPLDTFYKPYDDATPAHGMSVTNVTSQVSLNKQGIDILYIGTDKGVFKTTDGGKTFIRVNNGLNNTNILVLYQMDGILYVGTNGAGVYKSTNGGASWDKINNGLDEHLRVQAICSLNGILYLGTASGGVYKSVDGGANWDSFNEQLTNLNVRVLYSLNNILYAGTNGGGVFKIIDGTTAWSQINGGFGSNLNIQALGSIDNVLYAGTVDAGISGCGAYRSSDGGNNWVKITDGLPSSEIWSFYTGDTTLYAGTGQGVYKITNGGSAWQLVGSLSSKVIKTVFSLNGILYAGADSGEFSQIVGGASSWVQLNVLLDKLDVSSLCVLNEKLYAGTSLGVYRSGDRGANWELINNGLTTLNVRALYALADNLYAGNNSGGVFRMADGSEAWVKTKLDEINISSFVAIGAILYVGRYAGNYVDDVGIYKTEDNGETWNMANGGLTNNDVSSLTSIGSDLYAGTSGNGVFKRAANDSGWNPFGLGDKSIASLYAWEGVLYAGIQDGGGVYKYNNNNWVQTALNDKSVLALRSVNGVLYAGTTGAGVYKTLDSGSNWLQMETLATTNIQALYSISSDLYVGTSYNGIFKAAAGS